MYKNKNNDKLQKYFNSFLLRGLQNTIKLLLNIVFIYKYIDLIFSSSYYYMFLLYYIIILKNIVYIYYFNKKSLLLFL